MNECLWVISAFWSLLYNTVSLRFRYFLYPPFPRALDIRKSLLLSFLFFTAIATSFHIESWSILKFKQCFIIFMVSVFIVKAKTHDALERPLGFNPSKINATLKTMVVSLQLPGITIKYKLHKKHKITWIHIRKIHSIFNFLWTFITFMEITVSEHKAFFISWATSSRK